ncbi:isochorismate synthase [Amnibacterium flavum]|uniref:isochorismate synthase n=1 Tax=Amnibacterium flavum TaxID=2173173 RepID=A0A2V1HY35_9MICO|nr:isochorismate synthase [Amnibacterium flavum]
MTVEVDSPAVAEHLLQHTSSTHPLVWIRRGEGFVGWGEALRWEFSGPDRFTRAATLWRETVAASTVTDPVSLPGTGLVAFAAFAFSPSSSRTSTLIVPRIVVGSRGGRTWVTTIDPADGTDEATATATPVDDSDLALSFTPGAMSADAYRSAVADAIGRIEAGEVEKVVLARDLVSPISPGADLRGPLAKLAMGYPDCWTFAVDGLIGSSPEMLVRVASGTLQARVLAGSTARGATAAEDTAAALALVTSEKDRDEHGFAVRSVLRAFAPHTSSLVASEIPFALKLPNLWHLASDVEGCLADSSNSIDLIDAAHPTAAVAGSPTAAAISIIDELEPFDRGRYAGPVGWIDEEGNGEWAVALRCAQVDVGTLTAYAGAGIVAGSVPASELAETAMKFRPVVDAFD